MVGLEKLGTEKDEAVRVGGGGVNAVGLGLGRIRQNGSVDVLLEELDVDAVKAGYARESKSASLERHDKGRYDSQQSMK